MYNVNEVSQVNEKYIFFHFANGTQDRKKANVNELKSLYIDVSERMKYLDFTVKYNRDFYNQLQCEYEKQNKIVEGYEEYIEKNKHEPLIKYNLHEVCYSLKYAKKERYEIGLRSFGVSSASEKASNEYWKLYKLQKEIEGVIKTI